jgi:hypothetical protein
MFRLCCAAAEATKAMLITANTQTFIKVEPVASAMPCRRSFDEKRLLGNVPALAGRYAR